VATDPASRRFRHIAGDRTSDYPSGGQGSVAQLRAAGPPTRVRHPRAARPSSERAVRVFPGGRRMAGPAGRSASPFPTRKDPALRRNARSRC